MSLPIIHVYDTLSGQKRPLETLEPGHVGLYVCGVTVYDLSHIGHARVFIVFDVITRYLRRRGYGVTYVRNHTDVDDKIIARAIERGEEPLALAQRFIDELDADMGRLGVLSPTEEPRVSTHIEPIIRMVADLIERGHAYAIDGDVYYAVDTFDAYGKLSGMKLDEMRAGERVEVDSRKRNPADFALWKARKPGEPSWESPWGRGRPGWHIECSAMSTTYLGSSFDIHGGGKDLVFPHHENEIAQSEGATGQPYANYWMHVGLVQVDGEKMSKSLGNFWTVRDVLELYHPEVVRYFMMSAHYRKPIGYGQANLDLARHRLQYLYGTRQAIGALFARVDSPVVDEEALAGWRSQLHAGMDDDFNSPVALAVIGDAAKVANELLKTKKLAKKPEIMARIAAAEAFFIEVGGIFGFLGADPDVVLRDIRARLSRQLGIDPAWVSAEIGARNEARAGRDWDAADAIRVRLAERFVELMDTPEGTDWRITPPLPDA